MAVRMDPSDLWQRSQGMINQAVGRGAEMLADRVEHYGTVASDVGEVLREKGEPQAADLVDMLAGGVSDAASYLRSRDGTSLWSDAQEFARGRTWLLAGIGLVGGMAAARAVRSANSAQLQPQPIFGEASLNGRDYDEQL